MKGVIKFNAIIWINIKSNSPWEKAVFEDTYREFYMQAQYFNQNNDFATFRDIINAKPEAEKLNYLVSTAAHGHIDRLKGKIPAIVNVQGKKCIPFTQFRFTIIDSHVSKKQDHSCTIEFISEPITWIDNIQDKMLIAVGDHSFSLESGLPVDSDLLALPPNTTIFTFKKSSRS